MLLNLAMLQKIITSSALILEFLSDWLMQSTRILKKYIINSNENLFTKHLLQDKLVSQDQAIIIAAAICGHKYDPKKYSEFIFNFFDSISIYKFSLSQKLFDFLQNFDFQPTLNLESMP